MKLNIKKEAVALRLNPKIVEELRERSVLTGLNLEIHDARKRYGLQEAKPAKPKK